jgi:DNA-binding transcriptional ArsR family regulator
MWQTMRAPDRIDVLEEKAEEVAGLLRTIGNDKRLLILCRLALEGELSVTALANAVNLSQSALSQHLAKLRSEALVATRREAQAIFYRIADEKVRRLLTALYDIYCATQQKDQVDEPQKHQSRRSQASAGARRRSGRYPRSR